MEHFAWDLPIYKSSNVRSKTSGLVVDHEHREIIRSLNLIDIRLYEHAERRLRLIIREKNIEEKLVNFLVQNSILGKHLDDNLPIMNSNTPINLD